MMDSVFMCGDEEKEWFFSLCPIPSGVTVQAGKQAVTHARLQCWW